MEEAHVKRLIAAAAQVIGVATSDKLGTVSAFAPITALTHLITDNAATEEQLAPFRGYPCDPGVIN